MKITKRQLKRIIKEEKTKLIKENASGIAYELQDQLDSLQYRLPEEINGLLSQHDRRWWDNPDLIRAVITMLDNIKGEFEGYTS